MAYLKWPVKDPDEVLDYKVDWTAAIGVDNIVSSLFEVPDGLVMDSQMFTTKTTTIWLSGGVEGVTYLITNRIVTNGARTYDQTMKLKVKRK